MLNRSGENGHPCHLWLLVIQLWWEFLSWMDVEFCQKLFFVCLIFMDDFFCHILMCCITLICLCWTIFVICPLTFKVIIDRYTFIDILIFILLFFGGSSSFISFLFGFIFFCSVFKFLFGFCESIVFDLWFPWTSV